MPLISDPNLILGIERAEDAGVYKLTDNLAIVQTVDFFTPIVDDPYAYGQISAANSLSDVYAKGGRPLTAMNLVCFPVKTMDISIMRDIMAGGLDKLHEANVILIGGHSVDDQELKYGLSVTGVIDPARVVMNNGGHPGDKLILTKPLGTGIISTAIKAGKAPRAAVKRAIASMAALNRRACEVMIEVGVHACTDITGFGFIGHAAELILDMPMGMEVSWESIPFFPEARALAGAGFTPGGLQRNREYRQNLVRLAKSVPDYAADILFDPQTSGGLFMAVAPDRADLMLRRLHEEGVTVAAIVGELTGKHPGKIAVR